jgi:hypothetical protein
MTVVLRTTGVPSGEILSMERFREIRVSSVSYRAKGPVHSKLQQYNYEIHPGARDHSHMCDNKVHAQAACAPNEDTSCAPRTPWSLRLYAHPCAPRTHPALPAHTLRSILRRPLPLPSLQRLCAHGTPCVPRNTLRSRPARRPRPPWALRHIAPRRSFRVFVVLVVSNVAENLVWVVAELVVIIALRPTPHS